MKIGIAIVYKPSASAFAATMLASDLASRGCVVDFFCPMFTVNAVDPAWDRYVVSRRSVDFWSWAIRHDVLISFCPVERSCLRKLDKLGIKTIAIAPPQLTFAPRSLNNFAHVIAPSVESLAVLRSLKIESERIIYAPWDCGTTSSAPRSPAARVLVAAPGDDLHRTPHGDLLALAGLFHRNQIPATIWYDRRCLTSPSRRAFRRAAAHCASMSRTVEFLDDHPYWAAPELFGTHAVTLLPSRFSPFGLTASWSVRCGAPIVSYSVPPLTELPFGTGLLVTVPTEKLYKRVRSAIVSQQALETMVLHCKNLLNSRCPAADPALGRLEEFRASWNKVLGL